MSREKRSQVHKRRRGCLSGCLLYIVLILGVISLVFVGACVLGFVENDPQTGKPSLNFESVGFGNGQLPKIDLSGFDLSGVTGLVDDLPTDQWPYRVAREGMTIKTLRGEGEAVLICCDGYTLLLGGGKSGPMLCGQLLLCGAGSLSAAAAMSSGETEIGGLGMAISMTKPGYLLFTDTQTKSKAYNSMLSAAQKTGVTQMVVPQQGLTFSLGRATVTVIGPTYRNHLDERDDGLSVRIDYGATSALVMGGVTGAGEREIRSAGAPLDADVLICAQGGTDDATSADFVAAVSPKAALLTGRKPANQVIVRLQKAGAKVYTARDHGVMTVYSDGANITVSP